jgi:hypothetical protein
LIATNPVGVIATTRGMTSAVGLIPDAWTEITMRKIGDVLGCPPPGRSKHKIAASRRPQPDWAAVHRELRY